MKTILKFLALLVGLSLTTCREKEPDPNILPPATQSGANTAGCLVNGKVWVASKKSNSSGFHVGATRAEIYNNLHTIGLELKRVHNSYNKIYIKTVIEDFELNKEYSIPNKEYSTPMIDSTIDKFSNRAIYDEDTFEYTNYFTTDPPKYTGKIKITRLDIPNKIMSGTFEFDAVNRDGKVVHITEGRFDRKFD